jgi:hypothetical protein
VKAIQPGADQSYLRSAAILDVTARAVAFGQMHRVGDDNLVVNASDVELGYVADPAASSDTAAGQFQTGSTAPFPNSVRVTVRRDANVSKGALPLFFGPVTGTPTASRTAAAVATLRGQSVKGFVGAGHNILPIVMSQNSYNFLTGAVQCPSGVLSDNFTYTSRTDGGPAPPANVTAGGDGVKEIALFPDPIAPGNFGLLSLSNTSTTNTGPFTNWVLNGPSAADLASFGPNGLTTGAVAYGGPGMKSPVTDAFIDIIGRPSIVPIAGDPTGTGSNARFPIVGFAGAVVVSVDLKKNSVYVQLCPVTDPTVTLGVGPNANPSVFIYQGISLSR